MKRDIIFPTSDFVFSLRVGGLLVQNGSVLLQKPKNDDYAIIGGHVSALETTDEALKREYMEELHAEIEVDRLLAVGELFFPRGDKPCHQICLIIKSALSIRTAFPWTESFMDMMKWKMNVLIWTTAGYRWSI